MASPLSNRLTTLESKTAPASTRSGIVIRIVANQEDEDEARALLIAEGYDPNGNDIGIIRLIAPTPRSTQPQREHSGDDA